MNKHSPESKETYKEHMRQQRQGVQSTKDNKKEQDTYLQVWYMKQIMYTDQPGAFPIRSNQGNRYLIILCKIDSNAILAETMKNGTSGKMMKAYKKLWND